MKRLRNSANNMSSQRARPLPCNWNSFELIQYRRQSLQAQLVFHSPCVWTLSLCVQCLLGTPLAQNNWGQSFFVYINRKCTSRYSNNSSTRAKCSVGNANVHAYHAHILSFTCSHANIIRRRGSAETEAYLCTVLGRSVQYFLTCFGLDGPTLTSRSHWSLWLRTLSLPPHLCFQNDTSWSLASKTHKATIAMGRLFYTLAAITDDTAIKAKKNFCRPLFVFQRGRGRVAQAPAEGQRCNTVFSHLAATWKNNSNRA